MFPSIKMEEYMKPELSGIFWAKMAAKNIVLVSSGTHFMHRFYQSFTLQGYGKTLLHQRRSEAVVCRCFTKEVLLKILQSSKGNTCVGVMF